MKNLLSFLVAFAFTSAYAQPTIVQSSAPTVGTTWTEVFIEYPSGISQGPAGANQIWDLSEGSGTIGSDVLSFVSPSSLPPGLNDFFPMADVAVYIEEEDSTASYFKSESDGFYIDGVASNSVFAEPPFNFFDYEPDNLFIPFNFSYPDVRNNVSSNVITINDGTLIQLKSTVISELNADGYGTVITPSGTFNDVLRMETSSYSIDSIYADTDMDGTLEFISTDGPTDAEISYFWLQNTEPVLVASVDLDEDQTTVSYFSYLLVGASGLEENQDELGLNLFPNPSLGNFSIRTDWNGETALRIIDLNGKDVFREDFTSSGTTHEISLKGVSSGTYMLEVRTEDGKKTSRITIE